MKQLDYFFRPKSVAIIGASRNPKKIGHVMLRNLIEGKFQGKIKYRFVYASILVCDQTAV